MPSTDPFYSACDLPFCLCHSRSSIQWLSASTNGKKKCQLVHKANLSDDTWCYTLLYSIVHAACLIASLGYWPPQCDVGLRFSEHFVALCSDWFKNNVWICVFITMSGLVWIHLKGLVMSVHKNPFWSLANTVWILHPSDLIWETIRCVYIETF